MFKTAQSATRYVETTITVLALAFCLGGAGRAVMELAQGAQAANPAATQLAKAPGASRKA